MVEVKGQSDKLTLLFPLWFWPEDESELLLPTETVH